MEIFNGWFNGIFAKCMARNENNFRIATAVTLKKYLLRISDRRVVRLRSGIAAGAPIVSAPSFNPLSPR